MPADLQIPLHTLHAFVLVMFRVGGVFIFIIGGFMGSAVGAVAAGLALPAFATVHRLLARGGLIEMKHFLPLALGIVLTLCAFIIGA